MKFTKFKTVNNSTYGLSDLGDKKYLSGKSLLDNLHVAAVEVKSSFIQMGKRADFVFTNVTNNKISITTSEVIDITELEY